MCVCAAFSEKQFLDWLERVMPWTIRLGAAALALEVLQALVRCVCVRAYVCVSVCVVVVVVVKTLLFIFLCQTRPHL